MIECHTDYKIGTILRSEEKAWVCLLELVCFVVPGSIWALVGKLLFFTGGSLNQSAELWALMSFAVLGGVVMGTTSVILSSINDKRYSRESLLSCLSEEEKTQVLNFKEQQVQQSHLLCEYEDCQADFLIKYFGECNKEMLHKVRTLVEQDPKLLIALTHSESEEYKKIKPQEKIEYKV